MLHDQFCWALKSPCSHSSTADNDYLLVTQPYNDLGPVLDAKIVDQVFRPNGRIALDYSHVESNAVYVNIKVTGLNPDLASPLSALNLSFSSADSGENLLANYSFSGNHTFYVDRSSMRGDNGVMRPSVENVKDEEWICNASSSKQMHWIVVDRSIAEFYVDSGLHTGTMSYFPTQPLTRLDISTSHMPHGATVVVQAWGLKSIWASQQDQDGIVVGNITRGS